MLVISGCDDVIMGFGAAAAPSSKGVVSSPAKSMLQHGFLRPGFSSPLEGSCAGAGVF